jgi:hypothetical protein
MRYCPGQAFLANVNRRSTLWTGVGAGRRLAELRKMSNALRHAVGNRLRWNVLAGFAGNEYDATPVFLQHSRQIFSCEADTTLHIHLEKSHQICVEDFPKPQEAFDPLIFTVNIGRPGDKSKECGDRCRTA